MGADDDDDDDGYDDDDDDDDDDDGDDDGGDDDDDDDDDDERERERCMPHRCPPLPTVRCGPRPRLCIKSKHMSKYFLTAHTSGIGEIQKK